MTDNTLKALKWIVEILNANNIPYRLGGGAATFIYGSGRKINDIDISISGQDYLKLMPLVEKYVVAGPKHYLNEKWDCTTLSLSYNGQEIDLTDVDTLLMKSSDNSGWLKNKEIYQKWPNVIKEVDGVLVTLMHPKVLLEYNRTYADGTLPRCPTQNNPHRTTCTPRHILLVRLELCSSA